MSEPVIRVENVGKRYRIGVAREQSDSMVGSIWGFLKSPMQNFRDLKALSNFDDEQNSDSVFWAVKDVSFDVHQGDVLGLIGRNGAGKSTMLKLLAGITEPSKGRITIKGRVSSLLEVGTGFHPELSGRENVFLNGAVLGMRKHEIISKFDEIVAFSEVENFIDTPVKRYSSGMYVRLAFAVAAHLEPEILLVDEVLAVGDLAFQRKCLGKMNDVAKEGRTVLFVSHNMGIVQGLCERGIFLRDGKVVDDNTIDGAVHSYLKSLEDSATEELVDRKERRGKGRTKIKRILLTIGPGGKPTTTLAIGKPARFVFEVTKSLPSMVCIFTIYDQIGQGVVSFSSQISSDLDLRTTDLTSKFLCDVDTLLLKPGYYRINVMIKAGNDIEDHLEGALFFDVEEGQLGGRAIDNVDRAGMVVFDHRWTLPG